ncbi:PKD-like family lipoprotein [Pedobacter caeni]|uniref:PKD-like family protein n=1 Tax=Pedobacter caeni TaxID=288992 RepID=A0A1M4V777_9SPHI|nr:PKD-like family lipoprotein [Pedobacter caeni]SHE64750.1 PKD-like family protein [Pedobacter caeni]
MKTAILSLLSIVFISVLLTGCAKDKGNYDLKPINEITITPLSTSENIEVFLDDTLRISPQITQEKVSAGNYTYRWYMFSDTYQPIIELSQNKDLKIAAKAPLGGYTLVYVVKDENTGITSTRQTQLNIISRFSSGIVLLEEKAQGGEISHVGLDGQIYRNLYSEANQGAFIAKPLGELQGLYYKAGEKLQKPIYIFLSAPGKNTVELDPLTYKQAGPFSNLLATPPSGPIQLSAIQGYWSGNSIFAIVNGKVQFGARDNEKPFFEGELIGDYEIAPFIITTSTGNGSTLAGMTSYIGYDQKNGRFLWYSAFSVGLLNTYSTDISDPGAFNPNNVKKKCVFACYSNEPGLYNWLMKDETGKMYIYQMAPVSTQKAGAAYAEIPASAEMNTASLFAGSTQLPQIYYVSGNKVLLYDYKSNTSKLVYTPPSGEQITDLKLSVSRIATYSTGYKIIRTTGKLYLATYNGTEGKLNEFDVSTTGSLDNPVKTYGGFGKILSMFYKEKI